MRIYYYHVKTAEASLTWIGGPLKPADDGEVWLTNPDGEPVFRIAADCVKSSNETELAGRLMRPVRHMN
jgi:hypothetical protein